MPGIKEFLGDASDKLIIAELPDGHVMVPVANTITGERRSVTISRPTARVASHTLRFASRDLR
jgi:hypothetical protein